MIPLDGTLSTVPQIIIQKNTLAALAENNCRVASMSKAPSHGNFAQFVTNLLSGSVSFQEGDLMLFTQADAMREFCHFGQNAA